MNSKTLNERVLRRLEGTYMGTIDFPSLKEREEKITEYKNFLSSFEEQAKMLFAEKMEIELSRFLGENSSTSEVEEKIKLLSSQKQQWERFDLEREIIKLESAKIRFKEDLAYLVSQLENEKLLKDAIRARKERIEFSVREHDRFEAKVIWLAILSFGEEWLLKHY
jgi:hypothetical protein